MAAIPRVVEALRLTIPHAEARNVRLIIESHDAWCDPGLLAKLASAVNSPAVGICWDIGNSYAYADIADAYRTLSPWLAHVQFKDHRRDDNGKMRSVLPGLGELDLPRALGLLRAGGYSGWISFEWEKQWEPDIEAPEIALPHFKKWFEGIQF